MGKMLKIVTFEKKNDPESIPNDSRMSPEPFRSNFHITFAIWDPKIVVFQLNLIKKLKSKPEQCQGLVELGQDDAIIDQHPFRDCLGPGSNPGGRLEAIFTTLSDIHNPRGLVSVVGKFLVN